MQMLLIYIVCIVVFVDSIYVYGQGNHEMVEHGRTQYKLLKERSTLPKYGPCWKAAIQNLDEGCRHLSEATQSDIALHITNCFLEMSGHETYNCELDKKPNLRAICINSMTDRAFNVYTEFYTHTQNICWFLRGQIWHETIAENTLRVGKQLEVTAENQESLLRAQKESLELQERMIAHGRFLEQVLEDLSTSSQTHQEILRVLSEGISNLQTWLLGEVSWIDSIIFYSMVILLSFVLTSTERTVGARLPLFLLMFVNLIIERLVSSTMISLGNKMNIHSLYVSIYDCVWYLRYSFMIIGTFILVHKAIIHKDMLSKNNDLLCNILEKNDSILSVLEELKCRYSPKSIINVINGSTQSSNYDYNYSESIPLNEWSFRDDSASKENILNSTKNFRKKSFPLGELKSGRYNLRSSRQATPETTIAC